jgi:hypothetical protein
VLVPEFNPDAPFRDNPELQLSYANGWSS